MEMSAFSRYSTTVLICKPAGRPRQVFFCHIIVKMNTHWLVFFYPILLVKIRRYNMECIFKWFGDPGKVAFADTVISVGSIVVAIIALTISCKTQKQLLKIENRRERDRLYEKKKAYLRACGVKEMHEHGSCFYIHIENISMAEARNLEIFYDEEGKRLWDHPALIRGAVKKEMKLIGPKSSIRYLADFNLKRNKDNLMNLMWLATRKFVRGPKLPNCPPGCPNLPVCPNDFSLDFVKIRSRLPSAGVALQIEICIY